MLTTVQFLHETLAVSRALVDLAHPAAPSGAAGSCDSGDPVLCIVTATDHDNEVVGCPALVVGRDAADRRAEELGAVPYVTTVQVVPIGPMSGLDLNDLRAHLLAQHP